MKMADTASLVMRLEYSIQSVAEVGKTILNAGNGSALSPYAAKQVRQQLQVLDEAISSGPSASDLADLRDKIARFDALKDEISFLKTRANEMECLKVLEREKMALQERVIQLTDAVNASGIVEIEAQARVLSAKVGSTSSELEAVLSGRLKELIINVESSSRRLAHLLQEIDTNRRFLEETTIQYNEVLPSVKLYAEANAKIAESIGDVNIQESIQKLRDTLGTIDVSLKDAIDQIEKNKNLSELGFGT
jgi:hypothetical protein